MVDITPLNDDQLFVVQKPEPDSLRQPLQVHHLSHDLRGPLNSIMGFTELLLEGIEGPINDVQLEDLTAIRQSATNLLRLINTMVDLSKLADDRLGLSLQNVALKTVIETVLLKLAAERPTMPALVIEVPDSLPPLRGDSERLEQMIFSLLNFMFKINAQGKNSLGVQHDDSGTTIQIVAHNVWLSSKKIEGLFELAVHVDATGRSELGAGGLEMPLVRQLAQKQGGTAWAESREGVGTVIGLKFPSASRE